MRIKRTVNVFKLPKNKNQRLAYTDMIQRAVLDPKITLCKVHVNGGYDWVDSHYGFLKLLIQRGQILELETHQDLICRADYLDAISIGVQYCHSFSLSIVQGTGKGSFASEKRLDLARARWADFVQQRKAA